jgi:hypothetical protein
VERKFAMLKERYRWGRVHYRGLRKNHLHLLLVCFAMNLKPPTRCAVRHETTRTGALRRCRGGGEYS